MLLTVIQKKRNKICWKKGVLVRTERFLSFIYYIKLDIRLKCGQGDINEYLYGRNILEVRVERVCGTLCRNICMRLGNICSGKLKDNINKYNVNVLLFYIINKYIFGVYSHNIFSGIVE